MSEKEAYRKKLEAKLDGWNAEIDKLKAKADEAEADVRVRYHQQIEDLREKRDNVRREAEELKTAGDDAWEDVKAGAESAWSELTQAIESARSRFG